MTGVILPVVCFPFLTLGGDDNRCPHVKIRQSISHRPRRLEHEALRGKQGGSSRSNQAPTPTSAPDTASVIESSLSLSTVMTIEPTPPDRDNFA